MSPALIISNFYSLFTVTSTFKTNEKIYSDFTRYFINLFRYFTYSYLVYQIYETTLRTTSFSFVEIYKIF